MVGLRTAWGAVFTLLIVTVCAATSRAQVSRIRVDIVCTYRCSLEAEPPIGEAVAIFVRSIDPSAVLLLNGKPCPKPCRTRWRGVRTLKVRAGTAKPIDFAIEEGARSHIELGPDEDVRVFKLRDLIGDSDDKPLKIFGPDTIAVPQRLLVVNGDVVPARDRSTALDMYFDDVVALSGPGLSCTGIIVGSKHVLTAAHCAGVTSVQASGTSPESESISVVDVVKHPRNEVDVAILRLAHDVATPIRERATTLTDGTSAGLVKLVGFGATDASGTRGAGVKRQATIAVDSWTCNARTAARTGCLVGMEIVIAGSASDTCAGDSGGPAFDRIGDHWRLVGVTSRSISTAHAACGGGGIYTSVAAINDWISDQVHQP